MKISHNIAHYVIGGTALVLAGVGTVQTNTPQPPIPIHDTAIPSRHDWPALGQEKTEALGGCAARHFTG